MTLNTSLLTLLFTVILFGFTACKSMKSQKEKKAKFSIENVTYQEWFGGQPGVSGSTITFTIQGEEKIIPDSLYFRKKQAKVDLKKQETGDLWVASFYSESKPDRKMCIPTEGEYGNKPPIISKFPYDLEDNEAMLSYFLATKKRHLKITNITKKKTIYYP